MREREGGRGREGGREGGMEGGGREGVAYPRQTRPVPGRHSQPDGKHHPGGATEGEESSGEHQCQQEGTRQ